MPSRRVVLTGAALSLGAGTGLATSRWWWPDATDESGHARPRRSAEAVSYLNSRYRLEVLDRPDRTVLRSMSGARVAELTHGARTVVFTGRQRTFTEPRATTAKVSTTSWVRLAAEPFDTVQLGDESFADWLLAQMQTGSPDDVLAVATQYVTGSAERRDANGVRYAGDADFGYINEESTRDGADFYDYLGIPWTWPGGEKSRPAVKWAGALDCSGYLRLVFGYRLGMRTYRTNKRVDDGLPRTAYAIATRSPSVLIAEADEPDQAPSDLSRVAPGDLVFFALHRETPSLITHCGIVLGPDNRGGMRFVSSRQTINGPTFGDVAGAGVIDSAFFGQRLRRVIRL